MKVVIESIIECAADLYKYILIPPSLENTRRRRRRIEQLSNKPNPAIKKKYRRQRIATKIPRNQNGEWAVSKNERKGIYVATKIVDDDDSGRNNSHPSPVESDQSRIVELEKQLEELKRSLAAIPKPNSDPNLPTPPQNINRKYPQVVGSEMTPSINTPPVADRVPAPDFDKLPTPEVRNNLEEKKEKESPTTPRVPTPPPPPPVAKSLTDAQLCRTVPSGLHRTQSINDLIASGKVGKNVLRKVEVNRSPGGTPVRPVSENFLAKALRKKFRSASSPKNSPVDKENVPLSHTPKRQTPTVFDSEVSESEWDSPVSSPIC